MTRQPASAHVTAVLAKRAMDLAIALPLLCLTSPLWIAIAALVRLTSRGPVLYAGRRIGRAGRPFAMYKFRSMRVGSDRVGPGITGSADLRVTRIGRILRATKLDELPQLINVVRGDMSLVGPRPEAPQYVALYDDRQRAVLAVRPGITGPTQLRYRHEERLLSGDDVEEQYCRELLPQKLETDLEYVRGHSLAGDLRILFATAAALFERESSVISSQSSVLSADHSQQSTENRQLISEN